MPKTVFTLPAGNHLLVGDIHKQVVAKAVASKLNIFAVGGYVRDLVVHSLNPQYKLLSKDLDYAILGGSAFEFARLIADQLKGHFVALDEKNDTARVVMPDGYILDFAGCEGKNIDQDIQRRDFTINALYMDANEGREIVDLVGGIDDIKNGSIRCLDPAVFVSDPLRLLRAFRFAACLKFEIDSRTLAWIKQYSKSIDTVAGERISYELFLIFGVNKSASIIKMLAETGLLEVIFPELKATRQVTNNAYHHLNLFDHSVEAVIKAEEEFLKEFSVWEKTNLTDYLSPGISNLAVCKLASLLHDIGKPGTWVITEEGKHTFIGHERTGEGMVSPIAKRLRWSNATENLVSMLIALHLRPGQLFHNTPATAKGINRLYRKTQRDFPALILLALGDLGATKGPQMTDDKSNFLRDKFYSLLSGFYDYCATTESMTKLLDGNDIMKLLDIAPGKKLGKILEALQEAQEMKEVSNLAQAEDFVRSWQNKSDQEQ